MVCCRFCCLLFFGVFRRRSLLDIVVGCCRLWFIVGFVMVVSCRVLLLVVGVAIIVCCVGVVVVVVRCVHCQLLLCVDGCSWLLLFVVCCCC